MSLQLKDGITLYFSRHGETEANRESRFSGKRDTPLTEKGRAQAQAIGEILKREVGMRPSLAFVSSPLQRARTTMEIVRETLGLPREGYTTDPRIEEIDLGKWDQLTDGEARALDPALFDARHADKWHVKVPDGENYEQVAARATDWMQSLTADTFAVSHGALTRVLRGLILGMDWQGMSCMDEPQGVVFRVRGRTVERLD
ncbi:MAG: histidine phosphatase family protein [Pseudomonadota bacterium]